MVDYYEVLCVCVHLNSSSIHICVCVRVILVYMENSSCKPPIPIEQAHTHTLTQYIFGTRLEVIDIISMLVSFNWILRVQLLTCFYPVEYRPSSLHIYTL